MLRAASPVCACRRSSHVSSLGRPVKLNIAQRGPGLAMLPLSQTVFLDCLRYAHTNNPWGKDCTFAAACQCRFECLEYAVHNGCRGWRHAAEAAIWAGDLACLSFLHKSGCPMDISLGISAARGGQLQCLRYIHQAGCPWDLGVLIGAAANSRLDCLKYACENGCHWW